MRNKNYLNAEQKLLDRGTKITKLQNQNSLNGNKNNLKSPKNKEIVVALSMKFDSHEEFVAPLK